MRRKLKASKGKIRSRRVDLTTYKIIEDYNEWKKLYPDRLSADSELEASFYKELKSKNIDFVFKPNKIKLIPSFKERVFNDDMTDKIEETVQAMTWAVDFYLPDYDIYLECKGYPNDAFPNKVKLTRWLLHDTETQIVVCYTIHQLRSLITTITSRNYVSGKSLNDIGREWEKECIDIINSCGIETETSRALDSSGIDILATMADGNKYAIQCKASTHDIKYDELIKSLKDRVPSMDILVFAQKKEKKGKKFISHGSYAIMDMSLFTKLLKNYNNELKIKG